jgi:hypothetical protein
MVWKWPGALPVLRPGFSKGGRISWFRRRYRVCTWCKSPIRFRAIFHSRRGVSGSSSGGFLAAAAARGLSGSSSGGFLRRKGEAKNWKTTTTTTKLDSLSPRLELKGEFCSRSEGSFHAAGAPTQRRRAGKQEAHGSGDSARCAGTMPLIPYRA